MRSLSISETGAFAKEVLEGLPSFDKATVLALSGNLGAGKTTFLQELGKEIGITEAMQSPTFVIMKFYDVTYKQYTKFIHIDAYRLEKSEELARLGFLALVLNPQNLIAIEWAERVKELIPAGAIHLQFTFLDENTREIEVLQ